jgi:hypothetical protein
MHAVLDGLPALRRGADRGKGIVAFLQAATSSMSYSTKAKPVASASSAMLRPFRSCQVFTSGATTKLSSSWVAPMITQ